MRGIFAALTLAAVTSACERNVFSLRAPDGGVDAKADAFGPMPAIFSESDSSHPDGAASAAAYSLNR